MAPGRSLLPTPRLQAKQRGRRLSKLGDQGTWDSRPYPLVWPGLSTLPVGLGEPFLPTSLSREPTGRLEKLCSALARVVQLVGASFHALKGLGLDPWSGNIPRFQV